jgi:hypothetical protein
MVEVVSPYPHIVQSNTLASGEQWEAPSQQPEPRQLADHTLQHPHAAAATVVQPPTQQTVSASSPAHAELTAYLASLTPEQLQQLHAQQQQQQQQAHSPAAAPGMELPQHAHLQQAAHAQHPQLHAQSQHAQQQPTQTMGTSVGQLSMQPPSFPAQQPRQQPIQQHPVQHQQPQPALQMPSPRQQSHQQPQQAGIVGSDGTRSPSAPKPPLAPQKQAAASAVQVGTPLGLFSTLRLLCKPLYGL